MKHTYIISLTLLLLLLLLDFLLRRVLIGCDIPEEVGKTAPVPIQSVLLPVLFVVSVLHEGVVPRDFDLGVVIRGWVGPNLEILGHMLYLVCIHVLALSTLLHFQSIFFV